MKIDFSRGFLSYAQDEGRQPKNETLAEHLKHCKADKPDNCPFVKKAAEAAVKEDEVAPDDKAGQNDSAYMDAVKRGDMETAQRMVREVAEKAGYPTFALHGTPVKEKFTVFEDKGDGAFWFTDHPKVAEEYSHYRTFYYSKATGHIKNVVLQMNNPLVLDVYGTSWDNLANTPLQEAGEWRPKVFGNLPKNAVDTHAVAEYAKANGYDGVVFKHIMDSANPKIFGRGNAKNRPTSYAVFSPNQIKSADPVTYDDAGNVIPLSQRFNPKNPDIRY